MTTDDNELLRRYAEDRSEPDFATLVERHIDLVYSAALRQVDGDFAAAQDVTQGVFCDLARQARRLIRHPSLAGWLYTSTRYLTAKFRRTEHRRRAREEQTHAMNELLQSANSDPNWPELRPILDDAMHDLSATDRDAVLLRYFQQRPLAEIGVQLGLTENAARMRVDRALDKLRNALAKRGVTSTAAALTVGLAQHAVGAAPGGLALAVGREAMSAGAVGGSGLTGAVLGAAKSPILFGAAALAVLSVGVWMAVSRTPGAVTVDSAAVSSTVPTSEVSGPIPASRCLVWKSNIGDGTEPPWRGRHFWPIAPVNARFPRRARQRRN
ncbi:MAG: sigma-70 family RNA polymerase sigma factor [Verrucomicrobia bacterium]|nr:sigma-70 family RNA polymerase sigma factor [Verrucomicrobiota bacterium]